MSICNYYYKTSTLNRKSRKKAVEKVCQDNKLREAIQKVEIVNMQTRWLIAIGILTIIRTFFIYLALLLSGLCFQRPSNSLYCLLQL